MLMAKKKSIRAASTPDHQDLLDIAAAADAREGIRQGLEDLRKGRSRPAREFFREFEKKHGFPKTK
jgi:hypothetical protein